MKKLILITLITAAAGVASTSVMSSSRPKTDDKSVAFDLQKAPANIKHDIGSAD